MMTTRERSRHGGRLGGFRLLGAALVMLSLVACAAAPTPYREATGGFGYREQQLESNRYRVSFAGNSATPLDSVQDYALYRAAELTRASGHDYFKVVNRSTDTRSSGVGGPRIGVADDYTATLDILMFDGEKPAADADAYDAREVLRRLEPTIRRPTA